MSLSGWLIPSHLVMSSALVPPAAFEEEAHDKAGDNGDDHCQDTIEGACW